MQIAVALLRYINRTQLVATLTPVSCRSVICLLFISIDVNWITLRTHFVGNGINLLIFNTIVNAVNGLIAMQVQL